MKRDFVQQIQRNSFAYEIGGSVYFDIKAFESAGNNYARLEPSSRNDAARQSEGEGSLSKAASEKRSPAVSHSLPPFFPYLTRIWICKT